MNVPPWKSLTCVQRGITSGRCTATFLGARVPARRSANYSGAGRTFQPTGRQKRAPDKHLDRVAGRDKASAHASRRTQQAKRCSSPVTGRRSTDWRSMLATEFRRNARQRACTDAAVGIWQLGFVLKSAPNATTAARGCRRIRGAAPEAHFATWRSRNSSRVLQSMHSVAVGRASKRLRPISTPQLSQ